MSVEPLTPRYTPFFCEENIWQLARSSALRDLRADVVFISNAQRSCPLWNQRACREPDEPVFWDYHVIMVAHEPVRMVWDLDSTFGCPLTPRTWWEATFPLIDFIVPDYRPRFRVVDSELFCDVFSSDRSHMLRDDGTWNASPPEWPCIRPDDGGVDLQRFIDMGQGGPGRVLDDVSFLDMLLG